MKIMNGPIPQKGTGLVLVYSKIMAGGPSDYCIVANSKGLNSRLQLDLVISTDIGTPADIETFGGSSVFLRPYNGVVMKVRHYRSPVKEPTRTYFLQTSMLIVAESTFVDYCNARFDKMPPSPFPENFLFTKAMHNMEPIEIGPASGNLEEEIRDIQGLKDRFAEDKGTLTRLISYMLDPKASVHLNNLPKDEASRVEYIQKLSLLTPPKYRPTFASRVINLEQCADKFQLFGVEPSSILPNSIVKHPTFLADDLRFFQPKCSEGKELTDMLYTLTPEEFIQGIKRL